MAYSATPILYVVGMIFIIAIIVVLVFWATGYFNNDGDSTLSQLERKNEPIENWVKTTGKTQAAYSISTSNVDNLNACHSLCQTSEECVGFTYNASTDGCVLKSVIDADISTNDAATDIYAAPGVRPVVGKAAKDSDWLYQNKNISATSNLVLVSNTNKADCIQQVRLLDAAKSATFNSVNGSCQLKSTMIGVDLPVLYTLQNGANVASSPITSYLQTFETVADGSSNIIVSSVEESVDACLTKTQQRSTAVAFQFTKDSGKCTILSSTGDKVANLQLLVPA